MPKCVYVCVCGGGGGGGGDVASKTFLPCNKQKVVGQSHTCKFTSNIYTFVTAIILTLSREGTLAMMMNIHSSHSAKSFPHPPEPPTQSPVASDTITSGIHTSQLHRPIASTLIYKTTDSTDFPSNQPDVHLSVPPQPQTLPPTASHHHPDPTPQLFPDPTSHPPTQRPAPHAPFPPYLPAPKMHPVDQYAKYLRAYYRKRKLPIHSKWPPTASKKYIHLAVVKKEEVSKQQADEFTRATLHGNIEDIIRKKVSLDFSGIGKKEDGSPAQMILVEGGPGIGKTTFAWKVCRKWSKGKILQQYRLVVLLRLRDKRVREARSIWDLLYYSDDDLRREIAQEVTRSNGESVLLLYEGFDELPGKLQTQGSIFLDILYQECLPAANVLITSRPSATEFLQDNLKENIDQHIEILGFTKQDVQSYIQSAVKDRGVCNEFSRYLKCYPHISGLMYVPLNAVIITEIYKTTKLDKSQDFVPTTLTELYTSLTRGMLLRYLKSHNEYGKQNLKLKSFSDLPEDLHKEFHAICRIAFEGILKDEFIFDDLAQDFNTLDLMQSASELYVDQGAVVSHNFFHLTLQEFLAAVHVSNIPTQEQLQYFQSIPTAIKQQQEREREREREPKRERERERQRQRRLMQMHFVPRKYEKPEIELLQQQQYRSLIQELDSSTEPSTSPSESLTPTLSKDPTIVQQQGGVGPVLQPTSKPLEQAEASHMQTTEPYREQRLQSSKQSWIRRHQLQELLPQPTTEHSTSASEHPTILVPRASETELMEASPLPGPQEVVPELQLPERKPLSLQKTPQAPQTTPSLTTQDQGGLEPLQEPMTILPTSDSTPPLPESPVIQHTRDIGRLQLETPQLEPQELQQLLSQREMTNSRPVIPQTLPVSLPSGSLPHAVLTSSHIQNVVKFTAGLTKLKNLPIATMKTILLQDGQGDRQKIPLYSLHWLFEAQCISKYSEMIEEATTLTFNPSRSSMTPFDCFVLGYALSHINSTWNINIWGAHIGDEGLEMMVAGMNYKEATLPTSLKSISLDLAYCDISSVGLSHLKEMPEQVATRITKLNLHGNEDISEGVAVLLSNLTSLKRLNLSVTSISPQEVKQLAELLSHSQSHNLEYLNLSYSLESPESTSYILTALSNNTTLREIVLWKAHVSENNLSLLTSALRTNTTLRILDLTDCKINDNMVSEITSALCDNSTLQTLNLVGNAFGPSGATALAEMLRRNTTLQVLDVRGNAIGEEGTIKLSTSLQYNETLEKLAIDGKNEHSLPPELPLKTKNRITFC